MKYLILFFSLIFYQSAFSQYDFNFYIIRDNDGWVNVRDEGKIIDRLTNNKLVFVFIENNENWLGVEYNKESKVMYGSVHRTRLINLKKLIKIPISKKMDNSYTFSNELYTINISKEPFIKKNRTIKYSNGGEYIEEIDGQYNWGAELGMPKYQYKDISVTKNGTRIPFPKSALHNLFEPTLDNIEVYYDEASNNLYITSLNSDGAGGYIAAWTIENDKYKERLVTHGF